MTVEKAVYSPIANNKQQKTIIQQKQKLSERVWTHNIIGSSAMNVSLKDKSQ